MAFFRQFIAPLFIVIIFAIALLAVSARIFLPSDMAAPAPVAEEVSSVDSESAIADLPPDLAIWIKGSPEDPAFSTALGSSVN